jgi:hypothetical protein
MSAAVGAPGSLEKQEADAARARDWFGVSGRERTDQRRHCFGHEGVVPPPGARIASGRLQ